MNVLDFASIAGSIKSYLFHKLKLTSSQIRLIYFFAGHENQAIKMGDLAQGLHISLSTLSRQLSQASTAALITSSKLPGQSAKTIKLNQAGLQKADALKTSLQTLKTQLFGDWVSDDFDRFSDQLLQIAQKLQTY